MINTKPLPSKDLLTYGICSTDSFLLVLTKGRSTSCLHWRRGWGKSGEMMAKMHMTGTRSL